MSTRHIGRHRAPGRPNPFSELTTVVGDSMPAVPVAKVTTGLAVSGGLVMSMAAPATAAPSAVVAAKKGVSAHERHVAHVAHVARQQRGTNARPSSRSKARAKAVAKPTAKKSAVKASAKGGSVLSIAASLSGIRYRWGGTTPAGFDCSGFTGYVFRKVGANLPRTARAQQARVQRVSTPRPGDLVFFGYPAHHVGIYAGKGKMYDSPRSGKTTGLHKIWSSNVTYGRVL